jgi:MYXO-CTERM domain-containing protein
VRDAGTVTSDVAAPSGDTGIVTPPADGGAKRADAGVVNDMGAPDSSRTFTFNQNNGCNCATPGVPSSRGGAGAFFGLALAALLRRRGRRD